MWTIVACGAGSARNTLIYEGGFAIPDINLYPEKEMDMSGKASFSSGHFTCTYPEYGDGRPVHAYACGRLIVTAFYTFGRKIKVY